MKKVIIQILILGGIAAGLAYYLSMRHPPTIVVTHVQTAMNPSPRDAEKVRRWNTNEFIKLTNHDELVSMVQNAKHFPRAGAELVDEKQDFSLRHSIVACLEQLTQPTYKGFQDLHSQIPAEYRVGGRASAFIKAWKAKGVNFSSDPNEQLSTMWEVMYNRMSNSCHSITEMAPTQLSIGEIDSKVPESETFNYLNMIFSGMQVEAIDDCFQEAETANNIVKAHSSVTVAVVTAMCRFPGSEVASPICFTLYWSPKYRQWVPYQLAATYINYNIMF